MLNIQWTAVRSCLREGRASSCTDDYCERDAGLIDGRQPYVNLSWAQRLTHPGSRLEVRMANLLCSGLSRTTLLALIPYSVRGLVRKRVKRDVRVWHWLGQSGWDLALAG